MLGLMIFGLFLAVTISVTVHGIHHSRRNTGDIAAKPEADLPPLPKFGWFWKFLPVIGGIAGLFIGSRVAEKTMEGGGDSPSLGIGGAFLWLLSGLAGIAAGKLFAEIKIFLVCKKSKNLIPASFFLLLILGFWYGAWSEVDAGTKKLRSSAAASDIKNCRTTLEAYWADNGRLPALLEDIKCQVSEDVVIIAEKLTEEAFILRSYHKKGSQEYMLRSDDHSLFQREIGSEEWINK